MSELQDEKIVCRDCGTTFVHTAGEQQWMRDKWGDDYRRPVRCKDCRAKKKAQNG